MMSNIVNLMHEKAYQAMQQAYAKYSHFPVGACIRTQDDKFFVGCNVENAVYGLTQCAEANAIGTMVTHGSREIKEILVLSNSEKICPPCGACRQLIFEFAKPETLVHLANNKNVIKTVNFADLLPESFGASYLN